MICPSCNQEFEPSNPEQKICYSCFKKINNLREIEQNEIVFDIDDRTEQGLLCYMQTGINLVNDNCHIEIYYAEGQKEPHIHVKNIQNITDLQGEQLREYKRLFLEKHIPKEFWKNDEKGNSIIPDYSLCNKGHLIAEENKPHFKYQTIKLLRSEFNESKTNFCDMVLYSQATQLKKEEYKPTIKGSGITAKIIQAISIKDIARQFGLSLHGDKCLCPFHPDNETKSLVFYEQQGRFHCFGCHKNGNIIKFYAMLKELKPNFKYRKVKR